MTKIVFSFVIAIFFYSSLFLFSVQANAAAATTLNSYPTDLETVTVSGSTVTLYAGRTDDANAIRASCTGTGTCNTCALDTASISGTSACGFYEVIPANSFSIGLTITGNTTLTSSAVPKICIDISCSSNQATPTPDSSTYPSGSPATSGQLTIKTTWGSICNAAGVTTNCTGSFNKTFYVGYKESSAGSLTDYVTVIVKFRYIDIANTTFQKFNCSTAVTGGGFCYFTVYPGDKKAYIVPSFEPNNSTGVVTNYATATSSFDESGIKYKYLRVLYMHGTGPGDTQNAGSHPTDFVQSLPTAVNLKITELTSTTVSLGQNNKVTNLTNQNPVTGDAYLFFTANVDEAGLVTNYSDPQYLCTSDATYCPNCSTADQYTSHDTQCALPQVVSGLLDGQQCFIATASYGSIMAPEVESFRQFRGEYLLKSEIGKSFVRTYYKYSPPMAEFIAQSEILRALSRGLLLPILIFVKVSLWIGLLPTVILFLFIFATLCSFIFRRRVQA